MTYTIKDTQVPRKLKAPGYVRRVAWDDKDFKELHTKFASKTHGCLYRNNLAWEEYFRWDEDDTVVAIYYSADDVPYGYMVYLISSDIMHIKEMIYLNREAQLGLWEYIHAHDSMIDEVKGNNYYSEPIAFELEDSDIKETIRPYSMGRIIDVVQFMEHYACDPDEPDVCIRFEIEDELLPWNNDSFTFFFEKGHCVPTDREPDHVMKMTIASLTTLLLGYKTASSCMRWRASKRRRRLWNAWTTCSSTIFHMFRTIFNLFYALQRGTPVKGIPLFLCNIFSFLPV